MEGKPEDVGAVHWKSKDGRLAIIKHAAFESWGLYCYGVRVLPTGTYDQIINYLQWEYGTAPGLEGAA